MRRKTQPLTSESQISQPEGALREHPTEHHIVRETEVHMPSSGWGLLTVQPGFVTPILPVPHLLSLFSFFFPTDRNPAGTGMSLPKCVLVWVRVWVQSLLHYVFLEGVARRGSGEKEPL